MKTFQVFIFVLLSIPLLSLVQAQKTNIGNSNATLPKIDSINYSNLLGKWVNTEAPRGQIEFLKENEYSLIMLPKVTVGPYYFRIGTNDKISTRGYSPNWPPFYCRIQLTSRDNIKIFYWHFGHEGHWYSFVKVD